MKNKIICGVVIASILVGIIFMTYSKLSADLNGVGGYEFLLTDLASKLIPIETTEAGNGFKDLVKFQDIFKDKTIIAMGEATHGTKEFFQIKHRLFEFLVEKMDYRVFAMEAGFGEAQIVNDYILHGIGDENVAIQALRAPVWQTEEVLALIKWMRKYNENPENISKVKFYGFDMQYPIVNKDRVLLYLDRVDRSTGLLYEEKLANENFRVNRELLKSDLKEVVVELKSIFQLNEAQYIEKSSNSEYKVAYRNLEVITQWLDYTELRLNSKDWRESANIRDDYMAQNVRWILEYEGKFENDKIMLWAHNGHVTKKFINYVSMGEHLKKLYSDQLYVVGFDFYQGGFRAYPQSMLGKTLSNNLAEFTIKKSYEKSLSAILQRTNIPLNFIDFQSASTNKSIESWLSQGQLIHSIGSSYQGFFPHLFLEVPIVSYDGLIFVENTTPTKGTDEAKTTITNGNRYILKYYFRNVIVTLMILIPIFLIHKKATKDDNKILK